MPTASTSTRPVARQGSSSRPLATSSPPRTSANQDRSFEMWGNNPEMSMLLGEDAPFATLSLSDGSFNNALLFDNDIPPTVDSSIEKEKSFPSFSLPSISPPPVSRPIMEGWEQRLEEGSFPSCAGEGNEAQEIVEEVQREWRANTRENPPGLRLITASGFSLEVDASM
ncbi:hypothetical protein BDZ94DRAFT_1254730 [Collybia nuda]|uniref:Uncharacterized protein n=1 Tax=Collybia nuda TaxID=64659 RepID=A0A9P5YAL4_9AGAR|nr:hypothetical protein BDZ94DRAFT_1254730 [Collybia nuda]